MRTVLVLPQIDLIWKFMKGLHGFILNWTFLNFMDFYEKKKPLQKEKSWEKLFRRTRKSWTYLKIFRKKQKNFKAIWAVLGHSKPKIFSIGQPWWLTFFGDLAPTPTPPSPNYFSTATVLPSWRNRYTHLTEHSSKGLSPLSTMILIFIGNTSRK